MDKFIERSVEKNFDAKKLASGDLLIKARTKDGSANLLKQTNIRDLQITKHLSRPSIPAKATFWKLMS